MTIKNYSIKKLLSYLFQIHIVRTRGDFGNVLEVNLDSGQLLLDAQNSNYSFGNLQKAFAYAFSKIEWNNYSIDHVLSLGFGAGSIVPLLRKNGIKSSITGIENDAKVIELFHTYFYTEKFEPLSIIHKDAFTYLENNENTYDLIIVDLFNDLHTHQGVFQSTFIDQLKKSISPNGIVVINTIGLNAQEKELILQLEEALQKHFSKVETHIFQGLNQLLIVKV